MPRPRSSPPAVPPLPMAIQTPWQTNAIVGIEYRLAIRYTHMITNRFYSPRFAPLTVVGELPVEPTLQFPTHRGNLRPCAIEHWAGPIIRRDLGVYTLDLRRLDMRYQR